MPAPWIDIDLDKPRKLRYRHNDLADLEQTSGKGIGDLMSAHGQTFHGIRLLLAYGLRWSDPKMTPTIAGTLIDGWMQAGNTLDALNDKITDALKASGYLKADTEEDEGKNAPAEATP